MSNFNEASLEQAIIELFQEQGYLYQKGDSIHRKFEDVILIDDLFSYLNNKYSNDQLTKTEIKIIISTLVNVGNFTSLYQNSKESFYLVKEGFDLTREDVNKTPIHIDYIDFNNLDNNIFKVVNQMTIIGSHTRIPDMILYINGIPVTIFEFKSAVKTNTTIADAWKQIHIRYTRDIENLLKYTFISVLSDGANTKLGTIFTPYEYYYSWNKANEEDKVSNGLSSLLTMIKGAFSKERILSIIEHFVYYPESENKENAIVCRYPQFFAANKLAINIKDHMKPLGDGKGGTYFGATGCGKTYTMLFLAKLITHKYREDFNNPTIVIITDREDLNSQTEAVFSGAKRYLHEQDIRSFDSIEDLNNTLKGKNSGGVYITTIQKFTEVMSLLTDRNNVICISDEAHRTQVNLGSKIKEKKPSDSEKELISPKGITYSYGFAQHLRWSLPNATYCGFTGTPIDETIAVFGDIVDSYTMKEATDDGITVRISYEPRLARIIISENQSKQIENYYKKCSEEGSTEEQINDSKKAMASISKILSHDDVIDNVAFDIVNHYEKLTFEKPNITQKAMIVCSTREHAFKLIKAIEKVKPEWTESRKTDDDSKLSLNELEKLDSLPKINLVATRGQDDVKELYDLCGDKAYRKKLDVAFKNNNSNFKIAVVVDMWITGFDVPSLAVMYINKPLQKHTLIQTISRVNRVFEGKDKGLVVDYIGIKENMMAAIKVFGGPIESPIDDIKLSVEIFRNHISLINNLFVTLDKNDFFNGSESQRLMCLNLGCEFIQVDKDVLIRFMGLSKRLKSAYNLAVLSGELEQEEINYTHFYLAIRSLIYKQTNDNSPDTEIMNSYVESMVNKALSCTGVENIVNPEKEVDIFSEEFLEEIDKLKLPITKFNALLKLLKQAIKEYGKVNKVKSREFNDMLEEVVKKYNERENYIFASEVVEDFIQELSNEILIIMKKLQEDKTSFEKLGITFEEKAFYDILIRVRDDHNFDYSDEKCLELSREVKILIDDKSQYTDWATKQDIRSQLNMDLTVLLYTNGYPPTWSKEIFEKILEQTENFKKYTD